MIRAYSLYIAWIIALISIFGSIYIGEVKGIEPCPLCWYQRICMYPLGVILPIAIYRQDIAIKVYIFPQIVIGALLSLVQYLEQTLSSFQIKICGWEKDCSETPYTFLGSSLALWSLFAFCLLIFFVLLSKNISHKQES